MERQRGHWRWQSEAGKGRERKLERKGQGEWMGVNGAGTSKR